MVVERQREREARGQLRIAIQRLAQKYPFHAAVLEQFELRARPETRTVAVAISGDDVLLLYHTDFVLNLPLDQLAGVLLHELHHVLLGHVVADPADYVDQWARTVAEEITANEFVTEPLPAGGINLGQFPDLPPMESTDERYRRLQHETKRYPLSPPGPADAGSAGQGAETSSGEDLGGTLLDDHSIWEETRPDLQRAEACVETIVEKAIIRVGDASFNSVPKTIREALGRMGIGSTPGDRLEEIAPCGAGSIDWRKVLRHYIGRELTPRPDFMVPPRRFPGLVGVVPGRRRRGGRPHVMAVIDTSASISTDLLAAINSELHRLAHEHRVIVVECDTKVRRVTPYRPLGSVLGRGGTDLRPPFEPKFLSRYRPDLILYFTDGQGPAPEKAPRVPTIWCLTPQGERPAQWGREVRMSAPERTTRV